MKIYVGNLRYDISENIVVGLFSRHGAVEEVWFARTRSGEPHCFGFVHMADSEAAQRAIGALDGYELEGRPMEVSKARASVHSEWD
ncbi:MAG TPA: RNA-binding protein [Vicinamibacteria bacterium]|nr:RNA-binding protein [Vicinamibacteria bacterium]